MPRSQGVISFAHHSAKAEVRGANPRESSNFIASVPQQSQDEFSKLVIVGASPATDARRPNASCPRSSVRSERHRAKVEVAGAIPAVDAILPLCLRRDRASLVNLFCGRARALDASPTSGSRLKVEGRRQKPTPGAACQF